MEEINIINKDIKYLNENITENYFDAHKYFIINKPIGVLSTKEDSQTHETIYNIAAKLGFPTDNIGLVGRLDKETSGLILMTSDSRLNRALTYPCEESEVNVFKEKEYLLTVCSERLYKLSNFQELENEMEEPFSFSRNGVIKYASKSKVKIIRHWQDEDLSKSRPHLGWCIEVKISLKEGKHHQVRRIANRSNLKVLSLQRTRMANIISLDSIPNPNDNRFLTFKEICTIYKGLNISYNQEEIYGKKFKIA